MNEPGKLPHETKDKPTGLRRYLYALVIVWTATVLALFLWTLWQTRQGTRNLASRIAVAYFNKDHAIRKWAAAHGGVYVPVDERTPPNPYLKHVPERDIRTPSGRKLTLMNPAYMLRQLQEEFSKSFGVRAHITSLKHFRPETAPDAWEKAALASFEKGMKEAKDFTEIEGEPHLRLMKPLVTREDCLKCHAFQGYRKGDVRGGVGVSLPLKPFVEAETRQITAYSLAYGSIALVGIAGIVLGMRRLERRDIERNLARQTVEHAYRDVERLNRALLEERSMFVHGNVVVFKRMNKEEWPVEYVSPNVEDVLGYTVDEFLTGKITYAQIIREEDVERFTNEVGKHLDSGAAGFKHEDYRVRRKDGESIWLYDYTTVVSNEKGEVSHYLGYVIDISSKKQAEEALRRAHDELEQRVEKRTEELAGANRHLKEEIVRRATAEEEVRHANERTTRILESISDGFFVLDNDLVVTYFNKAAEELLGRKCEEVKGRGLFDAFPQAKGSVFEEHYVKALMEKKPLSFETFFEVEPYRNWYDVRVFPHKEGISVYFLVTTDRKEREEQIEASLREKEVLLREIHHRVKNNLALVNSLLSLQSERADDEHRVMFEDLEARVRSMAMAHERLYQSENLARLDVKDYVNGLVDHLVDSFPLGTQIELKKEIGALSLGLDTAIPLGFVLTELISNCLKHAFPDRRAGEIRISLSTTGEKMFELVVGDNGVGIPEDVDTANPGSLGLDLVHAFVSKLKGDMDILRDHGTQVRLRFKEIE